jgi:hypothetical protein
MNQEAEIETSAEEDQAIELRRERIDWVMRGFKDPLRSYNAHAAGAAKRGVEFLLTFPEWWDLWRNYYDRRGNKANNLVMCRNGDSGPYAVGNVRIGTVTENGRDRIKEKKPRPEGQPAARQDSYIRTALRLPKTLHGQLHAACGENARGFNAEILERLAASFVRDSVEERLAALEKAVKKR